MALTDYLKSIPQALSNPIGMTLSPFKSKAPAPSGFEPLNPQAQAIKDARPASPTIAPPAPNPAATRVKAPMATHAPAPTSASSYGGSLAPSNPAAIGGSLMNLPSPSPLPVPSGSPQGGSTAAPAPSAFQSQLDALKKAQEAYASSFALSPDILNTQGQLNQITGRQAILQANEKAGEANVQDQPIATPLIGGQQAGLQRQLSAQLGQQAALAVPLQQKLALAQMQREAGQKQSQAELQNQQNLLDLNKGVAVAPGTSLVQPYTGNELYNGIGGLQGKNAIDTFYNLAQTYPDQNIQWDPNKSTQDNLTAAQQAASQSPNYTAKANSFNIFTTPGGGQSIYNTKTGQVGSTLSTPEQGASAKAAAASLADQTQQYSNVSRAFDNAQKGFDQVITAFQGQGINTATNSPYMNMKLNDLAARLSGGNILAYKAGIQEVSNEYNQVFARGGQVDDKVRKDVNNVINGNATLADLANVSKELKAQGDIVIGGYQKTIADLNSQLANNGQSNSQGTGDFTLPDGTAYSQGPDGLYYPKAEGGTGKPVAAVNIPVSSHLAYVNNNPGNLRFAGQAGASQGYGGFAKFASPQEGYQALHQQIALDASRGLTLQQFVYKYAPPSENNSSQYLQQISQMTGASPNTPLSGIDREKLAQAFAKKESSTSFG